MRMLMTMAVVLAAAGGVKAGPLCNLFQNAREHAQERRDARRGVAACQPAPVRYAAPQAAYAPVRAAQAGGYTFGPSCPNGVCPAK